VETQEAAADLSNKQAEPDAEVGADVAQGVDEAPAAVASQDEVDLVNAAAVQPVETQVYAEAAEVIATEAQLHSEKAEEGEPSDGKHCEASAAEVSTEAQLEPEDAAEAEQESGEGQDANLTDALAPGTEDEHSEHKEAEAPDRMEQHCAEVADGLMLEAISHCRGDVEEPATGSQETRPYHRKLSPPVIETNYSDDTRNSDGYFTPVRKMFSSSGTRAGQEVRASSATELPERVSTPRRLKASSPRAACPPEQAPLSSRSQVSSPHPRGRRNSSRPPSRALEQSPGAQPSDAGSLQASPATSKRPSLVGEQRSIPLGQDPLGALVSRRPTIERTHSAEVVVRRIGSLEKPVRAASETNRSLEKSLRSFEELRSSPQLPPPHGAIPGWRTPEAARDSQLRQRAEKLAAEHSAKSKEREDSLLRMLDNRQQHALGVI